MIDYSLIAKSIEHYEQCGFKRIETPWTVTKAVSDITRPPQAKDFEITNKNKVLVASAEQGFLYLALKGFLPPGQYQSCGPCFRDETFDNWHTKYFIKNELIKTDSTTENDLEWVINTAMGFFSIFIPIEKLHIRKTWDQKFRCQSFDIEYKMNELEHIELGSYGIRECPFLKWIYGTACAEPRTSNVIKLIKI